MTDAFGLLVAAGQVAAGGPGRDAAISTLRAASATLDWDGLRREAESQGMTSLVCRAFAEHAADALPAGLRDALADEQRARGVAALEAMRQLLEAIDALMAAGIRALPFKGPVLSLDAYGDPGLRASDDIDVLVAPADSARAYETLRGLGYAVPAGWEWRRWHAANRWQGQAALIAPAEMLPLDLHWRTCDVKLPWDLGVETLLSRARTIHFAGRSLPVPQTADQLTLVLLHAARHGWDRLEHIVCAAALFWRGVDPGEFVARVSAVGGLRAAKTGLALASTLLTIPEGFRAPPSGDRDVARTRAALSRMRAGDAGSAREARLHLEALDHPAARLRYLVLAAVQPTVRDYEAVRLRGWLSALYPLVRLGRLLTR